MLKIISYIILLLLVSCSLYTAKIKESSIQKIEVELGGDKLKTSCLKFKEYSNCRNNSNIDYCIIVIRKCEIIRIRLLEIINK